MVYVKRDGRGMIVALSQVPEPDGMHTGQAWEVARDDDAEVLAFARGLDRRRDVSASAAADCTNGVGVAPAKNCVHGVSASDATLIRVLEDLIDVLIERGVIRFTDLPAAAQQKLVQRRHWRAELRKLSLMDHDHPDVI